MHSVFIMQKKIIRCDVTFAAEAALQKPVEKYYIHGKCVNANKLYY